MRGDADPDFRVCIACRHSQRGPRALGAEAGPVYGSTSTGFTSCGGAGFETRAGAGYSSHRKGRLYYLFADAAYIHQDNRCERTRIEIGYGSDLTERVFLTQQLWIENAQQTAASIKLENQIGIHAGPVDISLGYRKEIGGQFEEYAVLIALVARRKRRAHNRRDNQRTRSSALIANQGA